MTEPSGGLLAGEAPNPGFYFKISRFFWNTILGLEGDSVHQKVLSPGWGPKAGFRNLDGNKMDNVLAIRPENGNVHTNFFMRTQP